MLVESAVAVEREMVGKDSDGLLIGGVVELRNNCSCALLAASNAAAADCASAFDLGVVEKNCAILLGFPDAVLNRLPPFSFGGEKDGQGVDGVLLRKGFDSRRGMARRGLEKRWAAIWMYLYVGRLFGVLRTAEEQVGFVLLEIVEWGANVYVCGAVMLSLFRYECVGTLLRRKESAARRRYDACHCGLH